MKHLRFTIAKNALANLMRGGATAVVALVLPHFLTRSLDHDRFAAWSLMLQIAAYANYLDFGLQTAVSRYLARYVALGDEERRDRLVSTVFASLLIAAVLAMITIAAAVGQSPHLFRGIPSSVLSEFRWAALVLGAGAAAMLPLSAFTGALVGLYRNEHVALAVAASRLVGAVAVLTAVRYTNSLIVLALCVAIANMLGGLLQVAMLKRLLPSLRISCAHVHAEMARELAKYCGGLTVWTVSMFLVAGLDVTIVGHFDFRAVGYYSVAATLVSFFSGANGAVCSAFMTPVAALHASGDIDRIRKLILSAMRLNTFVNAITTVALFLAGRLLLRLWVGEAYATPALRIVEILMVANTVRLVANPYGSMLIATGQQRLGIAQGVVEGVTNFGCSLIGAVWLGPVGVAWGTLVGAVCGLMWTCLLTVNWVVEIPLGRWNFLTEGIVRPLTCALPLILFAVVMYHRFLTLTSAALLGGCCVGTYLLADRLGNVLPSSVQISKTSPQIE